MTTSFLTPFSAWARWTGIILLAGAAACGGERQPPPAETMAAVAAGEQLYQRCITCHQPDGEGITGSFPPLAGSEYATAADPTVPIMIVLHGMYGPLTVKGVQYDGIMPPYGLGIEMSDEEVAAVLTYVRSSWGNRASAITPQDVARVRAAPRSATGPVTAEELQPLM